MKFKNPALHLDRNGGVGWRRDAVDAKFRNGLSGHKHAVQQFGCVLTQQGQCVHVARGIAEIGQPFSRLLIKSAPKSQSKSFEKASEDRFSPISVIFRFQLSSSSPTRQL